jgi:pimeloyl-ACP methyl ester carboxylesterase
MCIRVSVSHLRLDINNPLRLGALERLASFTRVIRFDKRGSGLSDSVRRHPGFGERTDDVRAVLTAPGRAGAPLRRLREGPHVGGSATALGVTSPPHFRKARQ